MHSPVFDRMCSAPFLESSQRLIKLPEDSPSAFEDFLNWGYSYKPSVDFSKGTEAIIGLAIFAEKFQINSLTNQLTDLIKTAEGRERVNPDILDEVYFRVPDGAILRQLCSWVVNWQAACWDHNSDESGWGEEYAEVFAVHTDLGRDFFQWVYAKHTSPIRFKACQFHDHRNIPDAVNSRTQECPYSDIFLEARSVEASVEDNRFLTVERRSKILEQLMEEARIDNHLSFLNAGRPRASRS